MLNLVSGLILSRFQISAFYISYGRLPHRAIVNNCQWLVLIETDDKNNMLVFRRFSSSYLTLEAAVLFLVKKNLFFYVFVVYVLMSLQNIFRL